MSIAGWALPELVGWPGVPWPRILQVHLGAAPLAANTYVWVIHALILLFRNDSSQQDSVAVHKLPTCGRAG